MQLMANLLAYIQVCSDCMQASEGVSVCVVVQFLLLTLFFFQRDSTLFSKILRIINFNEYRSSSHML